MISLDTETTGVDLRHAAKPFLVTTCDGDGNQRTWEWDVDPLTREPAVPEEDVDAIADLINPYNSEEASDGVVLQNAKFDVAALYTIRKEFGDYWAWEMTHDTLLAGHLLASNQPHDLTSMALHYLGVDITPFEDRMEEAVVACRRMVQQARLRVKRKVTQGYGSAGGPGGIETYPTDQGGEPLAAWAIAEKGRPGMPSAKEKTWKFDTWLPRAMATHLGYSPPEDGCIHQWDDSVCSKCGGHRWYVITAEYANTDSAVTLALWRAQRSHMEKRGLWAIYQQRLKVLPVVYQMESRGVTISKDRLDTLKCDYRLESELAGLKCVNIAASYGYELTLPKSGNNGSLLDFVEAADGLNGIPLINPNAPMDFAGSNSSNVMRGMDARPLTAEEEAADVKELRAVRANRLGFGKAGRLSLDKSALDSMCSTLRDTEPRGKRLLFLETLKAKRSRDTAVQYMDGYERFWLPWVLPTGVVHDVNEVVYGGKSWYVLHPSLNPTGTDTLRFSSSNPNEQNISKKEGFNLRFCFGPAPGREWWSLDAKGIEDRLPAYKSGQQELIDIFERADEPPFYGSNHLLRFSIVYPGIWQAAVKEVGLDKAGPYCKKKYASTYYQWDKNGGFAVQYGAVERADGWGTADRAFHKQFAHRLLKERLSKLENYNQYWIKFADKHGYVETMPDKTVDPDRGYPLLCTRTEYGKILPTVPLNYHIQGTAMWWTMKGMIRCQAQLDEWNRGLSPEEVAGQGYFIAMQVHDEMVFDLPKRAHPKEDPKRSNLGRVRVLQSLMEQGGDDVGVPTPVGVEYNENNWSEGVTI